MKALQTRQTTLKLKYSKVMKVVILIKDLYLLLLNNHRNTGEEQNLELAKNMKEERKRLYMDPEHLPKSSNMLPCTITEIRLQVIMKWQTKRRIIRRHVRKR